LQGTESCALGRCPSRSLRHPDQPDARRPLPLSVLPVPRDCSVHAQEAPAIPVLIEAITVLTRRDAIDSKLEGGWPAFRQLVPNQTFCTDGPLARVAFMDPNAVREYVQQLEAGGLTFAGEEGSADLAVVDQFHGPTLPCPWLHFDTVTAPDGTTIRHGQLVPPGSQPAAVESLSEVSVFDGWTTDCTREMFLMMASPPEAPEGVRIVSQSSELPRKTYTRLGS